MGKPTIICVDDERVVLISLRNQLLPYLGEKYNVELAESGEEALEIIEELQLDQIEIPLIISDLIMPNMTGDELLKQIHERSRKTLKILLTGQASTDAIGNAVNSASLYRYIAKPWSETDLCLTVTAALRSYQRDKQLSEQNAALHKINQELEQLNASLEQKVAERTWELEEKNRLLKREEEQLRKSEERWQLALRGSNDGIWDWNVQTNESFYSPRWKEMLGYEDHEIGNTLDEWSERVHPEDLPPTLAAIEDHIKRKTTYFTFEFRMRCKNGEYKWILSRGQALFDENGEAVRFAGSHADISDRKRAEEALEYRAQKDNLLSRISEQFLNQDTDTAIHLTLEATGEFMDCDRVYVFRYTDNHTKLTQTHEWCALNVPSFIQDYQGVPIEVFPWFVQTILKGKPFQVSSITQLPDEAEAEKAELKRLTTQSLLILPMQLTGADVNQNVGFIGLDNVRSPRVWTQEDINLVQRVGALIAIAQAKNEAERALRDSEARFAGILDNADEAIISIDETQHITLFNQGAEKIFGYSQAEVLGQALDILLPLRFVDAHHQHIQDFTQAPLSARKMSERNTVFGRRRDGEEFPIEASISKLELGNKRIYTAFVRDITKRKRAEEELKRAKAAADSASRAKSEFLANMSHELRTPLNGILGYAQILQRDKNITPQQRKGLGVIKQCGSHLLTLINDILDLSKIEAQKLELHPTDFDFLTFLCGVSEICRVRAEQKNISFTYQTSQHLPKSLHADEKRVRQVLINLISNAIKFTDTGCVIFTTELIENGMAKVCDVGHPDQCFTPPQCATHKIRFLVQDTGIGIPSEQIEKIFIPFEQVGDRFRKAEGTGLGLAITQKIVSMMGSTLNVESVVGKGSKFWVDLDLHESSEWVDASLIMPAIIRGYKGKKYTILVVDDRWDNRSILINMLEPLGFQLVEATHGEEGVEKAIICQPDIIITDLVMPQMDGFEMTRKLRQIPEFKHTNIIATSASVFSLDRQKSQESGCDAFLPKPLQLEDLLETLQTLLQISWIYEDNEIPTGMSYSAKYDKNVDVLLPDNSELIAVKEALEIGDFETIEQEAERLKSLDQSYIGFAVKLLEMAQEFDEEGIINLIK
ncbi:PAS domain S-box protein [Lyngbya sp. PCC 8106]|uniref:PAS domain S-box protein n=1 Tax=Lyngbya sp. (strain PCC 8106) TaxID=313612 RepID=UPI0000EAB5A1|nr:PAS domain S-box protein [Lyngbya sp. PCC 8106]EAW36480.1 Periplasmic Sensor Hybrid Histidine Kinase [Lyngbya sp. PCC 8106]